MVCLLRRRGRIVVFFLKPFRRRKSAWKSLGGCRRRNVKMFVQGVLIGMLSGPRSCGIPEITDGYWCRLRLLEIWDEIFRNKIEFDDVSLRNVEEIGRNCASK
ncbi:hypothetical protein BD410DRAFT_550952 [Rickenella mellea]|uniref:Uncharacterized protein n=1 Tax=Rickenella mellea TaxID=50990 RepID=A0A4Y7PQL4_9AGAM|nr:hypothetical protein BD410DRAFT_550952 [Rickenella mellea]